ncbi:MAG TPA: OmpA family protein, partial [Saprospiraceae bacterium]|nr:OmpA family protein [Saprospiraceae bacterium]
LYYSSDKLAGLGGLDIFKTYLDLKGNWVAPLNLRAPFNSGGDDFGYAVDTFSKAGQHVLRQGYITSNRKGAAGGDDLFSFSIHADTIPAEVAKKEVTVAEPQVKYQVYISLRVMEPVHEIKDDPNSRILENTALPNGPVVISEGVTDRRMVTDELGQLLISLEWDKTYTFTARYRDHLAQTYTLNTGTLEKNPKDPVTVINKTFVLDPIFKNKEIVLENIFYDYDQWAIREDAKPELNKLSVLLKTNPNIRIQLTSHTDCRGTDEYNLELSQKRAQAAIDYLKSTGIPAVRLEAVGMGETSPAVNCVCEQCTEEQHQANRRTTFKVID